MPDSGTSLAWEAIESVRIRTLERYAYFIHSPQLTIQVADDAASVYGRIVCEQGVEIAVTELYALRVNHTRALARRARYSYQLLRRTMNSVEEVFRYDNFHVHPGHPDAHRVHRNGVIEHVGAAHAAALVDVLAEAESLWRAGGA